MFYLLIALIIIACVLLVFIVLIQNPKGGGLASNFSGSNNLMGVKRTGDILEKGTWVLVISIMVFSLMINVVKPGTSSMGSGSDLHNKIVPTTVPAAPTTSPIATPVESPSDTSTK
jgi:preprotein translocase subunit SecG